MQAKKTALLIEQDISSSTFDFSLSKYKGKPNPGASTGKSIVEYFEEWTRNYKQMDCEKHCHYHQVRNMIRKWDDVGANNILSKLNSSKISESTFNRRLRTLKDFSKWLIKHSIWPTNPLEDVNPKRGKKVVKAERKPFTGDEIKQILQAFKNDTYCPKSSPSNTPAFILSYTSFSKQ